MTWFYLSFSQSFEKSFKAWDGKQLSWPSADLARTKPWGLSPARHKHNMVVHPVSSVLWEGREGRGVKAGASTIQGQPSLKSFKLPWATWDLISHKKNNKQLNGCTCLEVKHDRLEQAANGRIAWDRTIIVSITQTEKGSLMISGVLGRWYSR